MGGLLFYCLGGVVSVNEGGFLGFTTSDLTAGGDEGGEKSNTISSNSPK